MKQMISRVVLMISIIGTSLFSLSLSPLYAQNEPPISLSPYCIGVGGPFPEDPNPNNPMPFSDNFCGCTWGEVYYRGKPQSNMNVDLQFQQRSEIFITQTLAENYEPLYGLSGDEIGAVYGDTMTLSAQVGSQTTSTTFKARPEDGRTQYISLVIPERGTWASWIMGDGYSHALAIANGTLWVGGTNGVLSVPIDGEASTHYDLPWSDDTVTDIATDISVDNQGQVWAVGPNGVAEFDGQSWQDRTPEAPTTPKTIFIDSASGKIWVGGKTGNLGALAYYEGGAWQAIDQNFGRGVEALAVDPQGQLWVGTQDFGAYRQEGEMNWVAFNTEDGLASNDISALYVDQQGIWFGTESSQDASNVYGGISYYDTLSNTFQNHAVESGLPEINTLPANIYALAAETDGTMWAATEQGLYLKANEQFWVIDSPTATGVVRDVAIHEQFVVAALAEGLYRLDLSEIPGTTPIVAFNTGQPTSVTSGDRLNLTASANDRQSADEDNHILAWQWTSSLDGPICTTANECVIQTDELTNGRHTISLIVQDDEGVWSEPDRVIVEVVNGSTTIEQRRQLYLPAIQP